MRSSVDDTIISNYVPTDVSSGEIVENVQKIDVVGEEMIIIGEVVQNSSSEGVKYCHTFEEINAFRDGGIVVGEAVRVQSIEHALEKDIEDGEK